MLVRAIPESDLDAFASIGEHPLGADGFKGSVQKMWANGESRPAWCFIVEIGGKPVGRIGYSGSDLTPHELGMFGLWLDWRGDYLQPGVPLLRESLRAMRAEGRTHLERRLVSNWDFALQQRTLLETVGLPLAQEKITLSWRAPQPPIVIPARLTIRPLAEVGDEAFVDAIRRVTDGTLDRVDQIERAVMGHEAHARVYLTFLKMVEDRPDWWQLAFAPDGTLAGLVVPQIFGDSLGAINYIGVTPEQRGRGYGNDLIAKGTAILQSANLSEVIADVDIANPPMIAAFERADYRRKPHTHFIYLGEIDSVLSAS